MTDYNGEGQWSAEAIQSRYAQYAKAAKIVPRDLSPDVHFSKGWNEHWQTVYPVMDKVIDGIEAGDCACVVIGIEFIEQDQSFSFGRILKKNTARALRRTTLSPGQQERILRRVFAMLERGYTPWEYSEYARLAKRIGYRVSQVPKENPSHIFAAKWQRYLRLWAKPDDEVRR